MTTDKTTSRDFSKIDGIPNDRWALAEIIYTSRKKEAWGKSIGSTPPSRVGYSYGKEVAEFDLALASAKAVIAAGWKK
jgi:hypothetical protein